MTVRSATRDDLSVMVEMGSRFLESVYRGRLATNTAAMLALGEQLLTDPNGLMLVAERDAAIIGMLGALVYAHPMSGEQTAAELFWWVDPEKRGGGLVLLRTLEQWARDHGAVVLQMIAPDDGVARLYERIGFERLETTYQRRLL